jgi:hypothetical protein
MTKQDFITQIGYLFWWVKNKQHLSDEALVETVLCYGDEKEVKSLFNWLGIKQVAEIFKKQIQQKRVNYPARTQHYFSLYFKKHVSGYTEL